MYWRERHTRGAVRFHFIVKFCKASCFKGDWKSLVVDCIILLTDCKQLTRSRTAVLRLCSPIIWCQQRQGAAWGPSQVRYTRTHQHSHLGVWQATVVANSMPIPPGSERWLKCGWSCATLCSAELFNHQAGYFRPRHGERTGGHAQGNWTQDNLRPCSQHHPTTLALACFPSPPGRGSRRVARNRWRLAPSNLCRL